MNKALEKKLKTLPSSPGVYFHKDKTGEIIYVGKAAVLKNRVRQYFQKSKVMDSKTLALVKEIYDTDWLVVDSEMDALFLEGQMIKRYKPRFNILLRDDKSETYIRINLNDDIPYVSYTRIPLDDGATYIGPYYNAYPVKKALRLLRKLFPFYDKPVKEGKRPDLYEFIELAPGVLGGKTSKEEYKKNLKRLIKIIGGNKKTIIQDLTFEMNDLAKLNRFEEAAKVRDKISYLKSLDRKILFSDQEFLDISKDQALEDLRVLLGLKDIPRRIEGYDISHMSGTNVVASMVVFKNGASDRAEYRKFKTKIEHNNDFYNMHETIYRRLSQKNIKSFGMPSLMLIDGGKGQLDAAIRARNEKEIDLPFIGLAKKYEEIVIDKKRSGVVLNKKKLAELKGVIRESENFYLIDIPNNSHIVKLLERIRDESHRFAVSYHTVLKRKGQTEGILEEIPGIGPKTRSKLIRKFGSVSGVINADLSELSKIVPRSKAEIIKKYLGR